MKWTVTVVAERTVSQDFAIEAETSDDAEEMALEEAKDCRSDAWGDWDNDGDLSNHQVTNIMEEPAEKAEEA